MKHLKKLSVVLMLTALFSVTFTSCIDNEVSPLVEAIYEAQADLIAAQAGVQNAEAELLLAQANATQAQADYTDAQAAQVAAYTAGIIADNAYEAAQREQYLLQLVATTNLNVTVAENNLALAEVEFEAQMAAAIAAMEAAGAQLAVGYAYNYMWAMNHANDIMYDLLGAKTDLANAQLMQNGDVSWEFYLAQMEGNVATAMATKANLEIAIADLEAYIANPSTPEAIISALKAQNSLYHDQMDAKEIEMQVQFNKIMAIYDEAGLRDEFVDRYEEALDDLNEAIDEKEDREAWIADAQEDIADWQLALDDYPTALAALELAVSDAEAAVTAAEDALDAANEAKWDADDVLAAANDDLTDANTALSDLNAELALLNVSYQDAIQDLADETAAYEAGLPAAEAALAAAEADLAAAQADVLVAQADYDAKVVAFEANPTGFVWTGGANGAVGIHADATTPTNSYREVNLTDNGVLALSLSAGAGTDMTGAPYLTYAAFLADATAGALAPGDYFNVGGDDVAGGTNADRLEIAADVLTAALDAIAPLEAAVAVEQDIVDNFGDALAAAQVVYDHQKDLYENQLALVAAAEAVVDAAQTAVDDATDDLAIKVQAVTDADNALTDANTDLADAEADLTAFLVCDDVCLQDNIDGALANIADWTAEIAVIQPIIDAKQAVVDALEVEAEGYIANEGILSGLYADLHAEIIAEWQAYWVMEQELEALENAHDLNADLISAYGWWSDDLDDLADYLAELQEDLADSIVAIEEAEQALASAQVEEAAAEAYIAYLEALIDTLEQRHANTLAIAAKYKALMDAALAS
ncbi:MAG TPA: hypothetical protein DER05_07275 [Lutibacter sp.]|nr:hypothetical protein [Lutibacter sp.]